MLVSSWGARRNRKILVVSPSPPKTGGFWWFVQPCTHSCTHLLQKEKSKDFRNHVTKYLETLLNSQQQVSSPSPCRDFTSRSSAVRAHAPLEHEPLLWVRPAPQVWGGMNPRGLEQGAK